MFKNATALIAGLGNIGSQTAIALTRLGVRNLYLFDPDNVEEHNITSQSYFLDQVGKTKYDSLKETLQRINQSISVQGASEKYNGDLELPSIDILIIAVDTMKERIRIEENIEKLEFKPKVIIDGRMGNSQVEVYTYDKLEDWKNSFVKNPSKDPCTSRYICYTSMIIGALIANQVKRVLKKEKIKREILFNIDSLQLI